MVSVRGQPFETIQEQQAQEEDRRASKFEKNLFPQRLQGQSEIGDLYLCLKANPFGRELRWITCKWQLYLHSNGDHPPPALEARARARPSSKSYLSSPSLPLPSYLCSRSAVLIACLSTSHHLFTCTFIPFKPFNRILIFSGKD